MARVNNGNQKRLDEFMYKSGWSPIPSQRHRAGVVLLYKDAGGGGDCMFHSIASLVNSNAQMMRALAASQVTPDNAPDVLMDMAAQCPNSLTDRMDEPPDQGPVLFSPERLWNSAAGSKEIMAEGLKTAISTMGNHCWGDATTASLLEWGLGMNIVLLAVDSGIQMPLTSRESSLAKAVYGRWVDGILKENPANATTEVSLIVKALADRGQTWQKAVQIARQHGSTVKNQWFRGRRQPVGSTRKLCTNSSDKEVNLSIDGYMDDRPTIVIWNIQNVHWVPVAVGPMGATVMEPGNPVRTHVDNLLK